MESTLRNKKAILIFVGPALLLYIGVLFVPILWSTVYSFYDGSPIAGFKFVGFDNFQELTTDRNFNTSFWFGLKYAFVVTAGQISVGLFLGILYIFYFKRLSGLMRTLFFFPIVLPTVAVAQMFTKMFAITPQLGLVNELLTVVGLESWVRAWLGEAGSAFYIAAFMDIWRAIGFYGIIFYTGLVDIPEEIIEAARLDGARGWNLVQTIILPLLRPIIATSLILSLTGTLKTFDSILALTGGGPGYRTTPLTLYMYKAAFTFNRYGYGSAIAIVLTLETLIVTLLLYRFARRSVA